MYKTPRSRCLATVNIFDSSDRNGYVMVLKSIITELWFDHVLQCITPHAWVHFHDTDHIYSVSWFCRFNEAQESKACVHIYTFICHYTGYSFLAAAFLIAARMLLSSSLFLLARMWVPTCAHTHGHARTDTHTHTHTRTRTHGHAHTHTDTIRSWGSAEINPASTTAVLYAVKISFSGFITWTEGQMLDYYYYSSKMDIWKTNTNKIWKC